jgi:rsbT antagonist protein RsbS
MTVPILPLRDVLVASIQAELQDAEWAKLRDDLLRAVGEQRIGSVVVDVSGLTVLDSFAGRMLGTLGAMLRLRGATMAIAGIQPEVAFSMVQLGLQWSDVITALDLQGAIDRLAAQRKRVDDDG